MSVRFHLSIVPNRRRCRVVAVTADAFEDTRDSCLAAGFDGWLTKPFRVEDLVRVVGEHLIAARGPVAAQQHPRSQPTAALGTNSSTPHVHRQQHRQPQQQQQPQQPQHRHYLPHHHPQKQEQQ